MENKSLSEQNDPDRPNAPERPGKRNAEYEPVEDMEDVLQDTTEPMTVPVCVKGHVRTQMLPTVSGGSRQYDLTTDAVRVLTADPRRRRALIQATGDEPFLIASTQADANGPYSAVFQSGSLLEITSCTELWARSESDTVVLSVLNEQWAE